MTSRRTQPDAYKARGWGRGVTLLELLVALGVIAILSAITVTGLRGARRAGHEMQGLAHLRSAGQLLLAWSSENHDTFFNVGLPPRPDLSHTIYLETPDGQLIQVEYLGQWYAWTRLLHIWAGERVPNTSGIFYALGCITDPSLWTESPAPWTTYPAIDKWRLVRVSETRFPSQKAMMYRRGSDEITDALDERHPLFLVDGSALSVRDSDLGPLTSGFYGGGPAQPPHPGRDTLHGVYGYDVRR